jgi:hypothetical protein
MTKSLAAALLKQLREVNFLLRAQAQEIANLRAATDIQFKRIAQMQAELDGLPGASASRPAAADHATVDFDLWARRLVFTIAAESNTAALPTKVRNLARFLRTVWNPERVTSGIAALESELSELLGVTEKSPSDHWFRHAPEQKHKSSSRVWRRMHAGHAVAEVAPITGQGTWRTCALRDIGKNPESHEGPAFSLLVDAHAAADALAQSKFPHECDGRCGQWHPAERRRGGAGPCTAPSSAKGRP